MGECMALRNLSLILCIFFPTQSVPFEPAHSSLPMNLLEIMTAIHCPRLSILVCQGCHITILWGGHAANTTELNLIFGEAGNPRSNYQQDWILLRPHPLAWSYQLFLHLCAIRPLGSPVKEIGSWTQGPVPGPHCILVSSLKTLSLRIVKCWRSGAQHFSLWT